MSVPRGIPPLMGRQMVTDPRLGSLLGVGLGPGGKCAILRSGDQRH
jgi:hypothetical protein